MVGCGEREDEVEAAMVELRNAGVDLLTIGQYLRPTLKHAPVDRFVRPDEFAAYRETGLRLGFVDVASGPLVRSSFRAAESYFRAVGKPQNSDTFRSSSSDRAIAIHAGLASQEGLAALADDKVTSSH
jgi:lipoic acid synthetase